MKGKYYAVRVGVTPGVYSTWETAKQMVEGYPGAIYKSFTDEKAAYEFLALGENKKAEVQPKGGYELYTDGSYDKNLSGWGFVLLKEGKVIAEGCGPTVRFGSRNVGAELEAVMYGLQEAVKLGATNIELYHDYEGVGCWADGRWKAVKHASSQYASWIKQLRSNGIEVNFHKVTGHSGNKFNEKADQLAANGRKSGVGLVREIDENGNGISIPNVPYPETPPRLPQRSPEEPGIEANNKGRKTEADKEWRMRGNPHGTLEDVMRLLTGCSLNSLVEPAEVKPEKIENLELAAEVILNAIENDQEIGVFGDYDADGVCSMAILFLAIQRLKSTFESTAPLKIRAPKRLSEGYGISLAAVDEFDSGLLIMVDNGITAIEEVKKAKAKGLNVIILDHHIPGENLPEADVVVDPHVHPEKNAFTGFCGAGLSYKLSEFMLGQWCPDEELKKKLCALAAIATVADVVPMMSENRRIVRQGLEALNRSEVTLGLRSILKAYDFFFINEETIAFKIAPLLNAPGRLYDDGARFASGCLAQNTKEIPESAKRLLSINEKRKEIVNQAYESIIGRLKNKHDVPVVEVLPGAYQGVVGIIAGKISEELGVPTFILSGDECDEMLKGSGRAGDKELNLYQLTKSAESVLERFGGHAGAVGVSIKRENLMKFQRLMAQAYDGEERPRDRNILFYDMEASPSDVPMLTEEIEKLHPFGEGVPKPVVVIRNIPLIRSGPKREYGQAIGKTKEHLKFVANGFTMIGFFMADRYQELGSPRAIDVIGYLEVNKSKYGSYPQVQMLDFVPSK